MHLFNYFIWKQFFHLILYAFYFTYFLHILLSPLLNQISLHFILYAATLFFDDDIQMNFTQFHYKKRMQINLC